MAQLSSLQGLAKERKAKGEIIETYLPHAPFRYVPACVYREATALGVV